MIFPLKPPFSYGFPMISPLKPPFSYGFPMVFLGSWGSYRGDFPRRRCSAAPQAGASAPRLRPVPPWRRPRRRRWGPPWGPRPGAGGAGGAGDGEILGVSNP